MKKLSDRDKIEAIFCNQNIAEVEAKHLLDLAGVIVRSRFPDTAPAKRGRPKKAQPVVKERQGTHELAEARQ